MPKNYGKRRVKTYSESTKSSKTNGSDMKEHISNDSSVIHSLSTRKVKYNVRRTTIKPGILRRMTVKRQVFYDKNLGDNDYMNSTELNFTAYNISELYDSLLANNSGNISTSFSIGNSTVSADSPEVRPGLLLGAIFMVVFVIIFIKSAFNTVSSCDKVKESMEECFAVGRRLTMPREPVNVFELRTAARNMNGRARTSYGGV